MMPLRLNPDLDIFFEDAADPEVRAPAPTPGPSPPDRTGWSDGPPSPSACPPLAALLDQLAAVDTADVDELIADLEARLVVLRAIRETRRPDDAGPASPAVRRGRADGDPDWDKAARVLKPENAAVALLVFRDGLTTDAAAGRLGITPRSATLRLWSAKRKLLDRAPDLAARLFPLVRRRGRGT